jgi:hypothetical protein
MVIISSHAASVVAVTSAAEMIPAPETCAGPRLRAPDDKPRGLVRCDVDDQAIGRTAAALDLAARV